MAVIKLICDGICMNCMAAGLRDVSDDDDEEEILEVYCQPGESGTPVEIVRQAS